MASDAQIRDAMMIWWLGTKRDVQTPVPTTCLSTSTNSSTAAPPPSLTSPKVKPSSSSSAIRRLARERWRVRSCGVGATSQAAADDAPASRRSECDNLMASLEDRSWKDLHS